MLTASSTAGLTSPQVVKLVLIMPCCCSNKERVCLHICANCDNDYRKGGWQHVAIPVHQFLLTWKGQLVEQKTEINAKRVVSMGISLAGGEALQPQGNFSLGLEWIKAERRMHGLREE